MGGQHHRTPSTNLHCTARGRPTSSAAVVLLRGRPTAGCCFIEACAGQIICRLCLPATALFCGLCVCLLPILPLPCPLPLSSFAPFSLLCPHLFIPCAPGSSSQAPVCKLQELSRWQQQRGSAVAARAPHYIHPHSLCCKDCPVGSRNMETAFWQPMRRCSLRRKRGRPRTECEQPAKFPTPAFCEPETACEQPGSLRTVFSFYRVH